MTISNYKDRYIKVESAYLKDMIANIGSYSSLDIKVKGGCSEVAVESSINAADIAINSWVIDLQQAVALENKIYQLYIFNLYSLKEFNVLANPVDLAYVANNCTTNSCTMEDFASVFVNNIKNQIQTWFSVRGITANINIDIDGNEMMISNLPAGFGLSKALYAAVNTAPYLEEPFGQFSTDSNIILAGDFLYIKPQFVVDATLEDGIYTVTLKFNKTNGAGHIIESSCAFIDVEIKCRLAANLSNMADNNTAGNAYSLYLLHYALVNGSNCGCNCEDLCKVYNQLLIELSKTSISTNITQEDCGC